MTITSFDIKTANQSRVSICAIGITVFEDGDLAGSRYWLVRPPKDCRKFSEFFTASHGLTWRHVKNKPEFLAIAPELLERLTRSNIVIAHSAQFYIGVLKATLDHFSLACPEFDYLCTYRVAQRIWPDLPDHNLHTLAAHIGHKIHHHNVQADAEAAARVLLAMMKELNANTTSELLQKVGMELKRI